MIKPEQQAAIDEYLKTSGHTPVKSSWYDAVQAAPTEAEVPIQKEKGIDWRSIGKGALDIGIGAAKGLAESGQNISKPILEPIASVIDKATLKPGQEPQDIGFDEKYLESTNSMQKLGKFAEQTAELAVPITKVGSAIKGVNLAAKVLPNAGKATKLLVNTLPRAVAEALTTAGVVSAQEGEVDQDAVVSGILTGAIPFAGAVGGQISKSLGSGLSARIINSLIKPLAKDFSYGKNPGRAVAEEGIIANSLDDLGSKIEKTLDTRVGELQQMLKSVDDTGVKIDLRSTLKPIDAAITDAKLAPRTNQAIISRLEAVRDDLLGLTDNGQGEMVATRNLSSAAPTEAVGFKRLVGKLTKFTGNASDDKEVNAALKKVYGNIKGQVEKVAPETKDLNERIADLISADTATKYRDVINQRQNLQRVGEGIAGIGGFAAALSGGTAILPSLVIGAGAAGLKKALSTPAAKTRMANWLISVPSSEKATMMKAAPWLKAALVESLFTDDQEAEPSGETSPTQDQP